MANFMRFENTVREAFDNDAKQYACFEQLLVDAARHNVKEYSAQEANDKIVEKFRAALGLSKEDKAPQVRRAIRANQPALFAIIEDTVEDMIKTGWDSNPFFMQFVDQRNIALGDEN